MYKIMALALFLSLTSCATTFPKQDPDLQKQPVTRVENTAKQNWINFLTTTWGAVVQGVTVGIMLNKMGDELREGLGGMRR